MVVVTNSAFHTALAAASDNQKDDNSVFGAVVYWCLFFFFLALDCFGLYNLRQAWKIGRLKSKSILCFYVSSIVVVTIRVILFSDVIFDY